MSFYQTKRRYNKSAENVYAAANKGTIPAFCYLKSGHDTNKEIQHLKKIFPKYSNIDGDFYFRKLFG